MTTAGDKPATRPLWLRVSQPEYDHIEYVADQESRNKVDLVRLALNFYFQDLGYDPLPPAPPRRQGRRSAQ